MINTLPGGNSGSLSGLPPNPSWGLVEIDRATDLQAAAVVVIILMIIVFIIFIKITAIIKSNKRNGFISSEGALRLSTTYDNHPSHPSTYSREDDLSIEDLI